MYQPYWFQACVTDEHMKRVKNLVSELHFEMQIYALYIGLVLSFLNRFPVKMPQRSSARRYQGQVPRTAITFKDVAGVDEAKEELAEVVVCLLCRFYLLLCS